MTDAPRDAAFGAAVGSTAVSVFSAALAMSEVGERREDWVTTLRWIVQSALALPGLTFGIAWAATASSGTEQFLDIGLATVSAMSLAHAIGWALWPDVREAPKR
jgi:hypothetical protein